MVWTKCSIEVAGVERMEIDINMAEPSSPIIVDGEVLPIQISGLTPFEAAQISNDYYRNEGVEHWGDDEIINVVELDAL